MKNVVFDYSDKKFSYNGGDGIMDSFEYKPSVKNIWDPINYTNFRVDLCINPFLSREMDIIELKYDDERCGYIFPCNLLDSTEDLSEYRNLNSYLFIAFKILLERIPEITEYYNFSDNFEDNLCICILNVGDGIIPKNIKGIGDIMHELRPYGYSFFQANNTISGPKEYRPERFLSKKYIDLSFQYAPLYQHPEVIEMVEIVPTIINLTHRFVILYQFFEYLMGTASRQEIESLMVKYSVGGISDNDFINDIGRLSPEKKRVRTILDRSTLQASISTDFEIAVKNLFDAVHYDYTEKKGGEFDLPKLFYSFRNQMTHSYRNLHRHPEELAQTIQAFEKVVFNVLSTYN